MPEALSTTEHPRWPIPDDPGVRAHAVWHARKNFSGWDSNRAPRVIDKLFSQEQLAKALRVSRVTVARWETGGRPVTDETLLQLHALVSRHFTKDFLQSATFMKRAGLVPKVDQRWLEHRARLFAWSLLFWSAATMRRGEWLDTLQAAPRLLAGVPTHRTEFGSDFIRGVDVGLALLSAEHGARYGQLSTNVDRQDESRRFQGAAAGALARALASMLTETRGGVRYIIKKVT